MTSHQVSYVRGSSHTNGTVTRGHADGLSTQLPSRADVMFAEPVSEIAAELRRIRTARRRGAHATARRHLDRLIDYVWFSGPEDVA